MQRALLSMRSLQGIKKEFHFAKIDGDLLMEFLGFLASPRGFEPPACRLGGDRSILLSYGDVFNFWLIS